MTLTAPPPVATEPLGPWQATRSDRPWFALVFAGGAAGIVTAGWQTVERIDWAANHAATGVCELSDKLSCSTVFEHWQSSALGIPNSLIALPVFAFLASTGLAGLLGSSLSRRYVATAWGLAVFMTLFVTWYMAQTAFAIGVLCLFCLGCMAAILVAVVGMTRVTAAGDALGTGRAGTLLASAVRTGADIVVWFALATLVTVMLVIGLT